MERSLLHLPKEIYSRYQERKAERKATRIAAGRPPLLEVTPAGRVILGAGGLLLIVFALTAPRDSGNQSASRGEIIAPTQPPVPTRSEIVAPRALVAGQTGGIPLEMVTP